MAFTFLAAQGVAVGKTQIEKDWLQVCWGGRGAQAVLKCSSRAYAHPQRDGGPHTIREWYTVGFFCCVDMWSYAKQPPVAVGDCMAHARPVLRVASKAIPACMHGGAPHDCGGSSLTGPVCRRR